MGTPVRSRAKTNIGVGESIEFPTTISASFVCQEDMDDFEEQIRKGLAKEESFTSYAEKKKEAEEVIKRNDEMYNENTDYINSPVHPVDDFIDTANQLWNNRDSR
jgi:hypothetical protein